MTVRWAHNPFIKPFIHTSCTNCRPIHYMQNKLWKAPLNDLLINTSLLKDWSFLSGAQWHFFVPRLVFSVPLRVILNPIASNSSPPIKGLWSLLWRRPGGPRVPWWFRRTIRKRDQSGAETGGGEAPGAPSPSVSLEPLIWRGNTAENSLKIYTDSCAGIHVHLIMGIE